MVEELCSKCKGRGLCGQPCKILSRFRFLDIKTHFSGSSPPEIFVGRHNYPEINTGILVPEVHGDTENFSSPENWFANNFNIEQILNLRSKMVYARFKSQVKKDTKNKFLSVMQEISMADKPASTEIILKRPPRELINPDKNVPLIGNPAPLKFARLEENPHIPKKVDYLVSDTDVKASIAIEELYKSGIQNSNIIKVLSAGLLGKSSNRKLVPTRWAITATDDTLGKKMLEKIRYLPEISETMLFHGDYVGNHYEFLLLPDKFSFEVLEAYIPGSVWNSGKEISISQDYESFSGRKTYADKVTGAYYTARLALCEYLLKIQKQGSCFIMREERPEYYAPLGVGILRELARGMFKQVPENFSTIQEALKEAGKRMMLPVSTFVDKSWLLKNYKKQTRLNDFSSLK